MFPIISRLVGDNPVILGGDYAPGQNSVNWVLPPGTLLANLEGPILPVYHNLVPAPKAGPHLASSVFPPRDRDIVFVTANNHIMDYGVHGLETTLSSLENSGIVAVGAGMNLAASRGHFILDVSGCRIGIISCCEAQFGIARNNKGGVSEFGPWVYKAINQLKKETDFLILSVHAAVEDSPWPSPYLRELCRSCIDAGASVIHGHHSHVPQGYEDYGEGVIFYGLGNFAVDPDKWFHYPNGLWSIGVELDFSDSRLKYRTFILEIRKASKNRSILIKEFTFSERPNLLEYLSRCNLPFDDEALFNALWHEVALRCYYKYAGQYIGLPLNRNMIVEGIAEIKSGFRKVFRSAANNTYKYLLAHHVFACESHRQVLMTALGILGGEIEDQRTTQSQLLADEMMPWSVGAIPS